MSWARRLIPMVFSHHPSASSRRARHRPADPGAAAPSEPADSRLHLHTWREPRSWAWRCWPPQPASANLGAVAALGDVAEHFGHITHGATIAEQAGLSGTKLGIGLAVLRLASLGGLPLAGLADRFGRRRMMLMTCALGLALTAIWPSPHLLVVRCHLCSRTATAERHLRRGPSLGGRADFIVATGQGGRANRCRVRHRLGCDRDCAQPRIEHPRLSWDSPARALAFGSPALHLARLSSLTASDRGSPERTSPPRARGGRSAVPTPAPRRCALTFRCWL